MNWNRKLRTKIKQEPAADRKSKEEMEEKKLKSKKQFSCAITNESLTLKRLAYIIN